MTPEPPLDSDRDMVGPVQAARCEQEQLESTEFQKATDSGLASQMEKAPDPLHRRQTPQVLGPECQKERDRGRRNHQMQRPMR